MFLLTRLRRWSLAKLVLVCIGWLALCVVAPIAYVAALVSLSTVNDTGSGGIGAVSGISAPLLVAFGPIVVLVVLWIIAKRTAVATRTTTRT